MRLARLALALAGGAAAPLAAQEVRSVPAVTLLPASVRSAGLSGAGVALLGSAGAVWDNPSAIAPLRVLTIELAAARHGGGAGQVGGAAAVRAGPVSLGGAVQYLVFDEGPLHDNVSWVAALTWRGGFGALGADTRYVSVEDSAGAVSRTLTSDLGLTLALFDIAALAVAVQGIGTLRASGRPLDIPTQTRLGFTMNLVDPLGVPRLLATVERVWVAGDADRTIFGLEGGFVRAGFGLLARVGVGGGAPGAGETGRSAGASVILGGLTLDYAWQRRSRLGSAVHRVGLRVAP